MEEIRRQLQETRDRLKDLGMGFEPKEADTMAAARSDDEEASITTNDVAAAGNANATETIRVQRGVVEDGGSKAVNDEANKCEVRQRRTRGCRSRCRTQKRESRMGWYSGVRKRSECGGSAWNHGGAGRRGEGGWEEDG